MKSIKSIVECGLEKDMGGQQPGASRALDLADAHLQTGSSTRPAHLLHMVIPNTSRGSCSRGPASGENVGVLDVLSDGNASLDRQVDDMSSPSQSSTMSAIDSVQKRQLIRHSRPRRDHSFGVDSRGHWGSGVPQPRDFTANDANNALCPAGPQSSSTSRYQVYASSTGGTSLMRPSRLEPIESNGSPSVCQDDSTPSTPPATPRPRRLPTPDLDEVEKKTAFCDCCGARKDRALGKEEFTASLKVANCP